MRFLAQFWQKSRFVFWHLNRRISRGNQNVFLLGRTPFSTYSAPCFQGVLRFLGHFFDQKKSQNSLETGGAVTLKWGTKNLAKTLICKAFCPFSKKSSKFLKKLKFLQKKSKNRQFLPNALIDSVFFFQKMETDNLGKPLICKAICSFSLN